MRITLIVSLLILFIACGESTDEQGSAMASLITKRDSLKAAQLQLNEQLQSLEKKISGNGKPQHKKTTLVSTQIATPQKFEHFFEVHGTLETDKNVMITSEIPGIVRDIKVKEGDEVKAGQVLLVIDTDIISKNIEEVAISLKLATTVYEKQKRLWEQQIGSEIQFLEAQTKMESLEQKLKALRSQEEMASVKAPFTGIVDEIITREGEMASPQFPLLRLVNINEMYIKADVSERYLKQVNPGTEVLVKFPSLDMELPSKILRTGKFINPNNRTFVVKIKVGNPTGLLRPNLLAQLKIKDFEADSAISLPSGVIQQDAVGNEFLFIADKTNEELIAKRITVKTGLAYLGKTLILEGLKGNEEVIVLGGRGLKDGEVIVVK